MLGLKILAGCFATRFGFVIACDLLRSILIYAWKKIRNFSIQISAIFNNFLPQENASNDLYTDCIQRVHKTLDKIPCIHLNLSVIIIKNLCRETGYFLHLNPLNHDTLMSTKPQPVLMLFISVIHGHGHYTNNPCICIFTQSLVYRPREKYYKNINKFIILYSVTSVTLINIQIKRNVLYQFQFWFILLYGFSISVGYLIPTRFFLKKSFAESQMYTW